MWTMLYALPYSVEETAAAILTPEQVRQPQFAEMLDLFRYAEMDMEPELRSPRQRGTHEEMFFYTTKAGM